MTHAYRSLLYIPGSKARALEKAQSLPADGLIIDLEDAVAPDEKIPARDIVTRALREFDYGQKTILLRVNGADTIWGYDDLNWALALQPDAVLLPKVETAQAIRNIAARPDLGRTKIWAMMETPRAVLNAEAIAGASEALAGFVLGTNDLAKDLHARPDANRQALLAAISWVLLAARAYDKICVDGVYNAFNDAEGLARECEQGVALGMDGKSLIHPNQLEIANRIFAPDAAEIARAHRFVEAFDAAIARGEAVAVVDGRIVENLHVEAARRLIALDEAIKSTSNGQ